MPFFLYDNGDDTKAALTVYGNDPRVNNVVNDLLRYYPISQDNLRWVYDLAPQFSPASEPEWNLNTDADQSKVLARLRQLDQQTTNKPAGEVWIAMIDPALTTKNYLGLATTPGISSWVKMSDTPESGTSWSSVGGSTLAQEVGHNLGFEHTQCSGTEKNNDPNWPHPSPNCSLATVSPTGFYGFDVYWNYFGAKAPTAISNDPAANSENRGYPFMGYKGPKYVSPYEYCEFLNLLNVSCTSASLTGLSVRTTPATAMAPQTTAQPTAHLATQAGSSFITASALVTTTIVFAPDGSTTYSGGTAAFGSVSTTDTPPPIPAAVVPPGPGQIPYQLVQLDNANAILATQNIALDTDTHESTTVQEINAVAPLMAGVAKVRITWNGAILAERLVSANPPIVALVTPNGGTLLPNALVTWTATDPDGDPLTFTILYSADNGVTWKVVALDQVGTSYQISDLGDLAGSTQGRIRVVANDGFNVAHADSALAFTVPNNAPRVNLFSVTSGVMVYARPGQNLVFHGSANDVEDGQLTGVRLAWTSSRDGALGTGTGLEVSTLSHGVHLITLTATDSAGLTATASFSVTVGTSIFLPSIPLGTGSSAPVGNPG